MAAVVGLLVITFFVSRGCQHSQIRVTQDEAIATARSRIHFTPDSTTIRLLRQGLSTKPFWIVVLIKGTGDNIRRIAQVHIDANTGEVTDIEIKSSGQNGQKPTGSGP